MTDAAREEGEDASVRAPAGIRAFVALPVAEPARRALQGVVAELARSASALRWTEPENMHITLKFLGPVPVAKLGEVSGALRTALASFAAFDAELTGTGAFPDPESARVVWVGVGAGRDAMGALARAAEQAVIPLGFAADERAYRAHVTLARVKQRLPRDQAHGLAQALAAGAHRPIAPLRCEEVHLMQSHSTPRGPKYTTLETIPLGAP